MLLGDIVAATVAAFAVITVAAVLRWLMHGREQPDKPAAPVTILKPLCGAEKGLYESLKSCCEQDYSEYQIVFGVRRETDAAVKVVRRLQAEYPKLDLTLVVDDRLIGANYKVSNLANMLAAARHDVLVIADSDIQVGPEYLGRVTAPLERDGVGLSTCVYHAHAGAGIHARLAAMFINGWFTPSVLVSWMFGWSAFGFGATLALRRSVLEEIGGFDAIADHVADDYMIGALVRRHGYETVLANYMVETRVPDHRLVDLWRHELRQARALRALQPAGYGFTFITFGIPIAGAMLALTGPQAFAIAMLGTTVAAKWLVQVAFNPDIKQALADGWLVPVRDVLSLAIWIWSHAGRRIVWRSHYFRIRRDGTLAETEARPSRGLSGAPYSTAWFRLRNALFKNL
jgi:ceramide glucosyltransferase